MDIGTLMRHSEAKLVGCRQCVERGLASEARYTEPGSGAEHDWCTQLANLRAYLFVAFKLEKEELRRLAQRKSGFLRVPVIEQCCSDTLWVWSGTVKGSGRGMAP